MTYDETVQKLSALLIRAGKTECTVDYINKKIKLIVENEGLTSKTKALSVFRSDRDIRNALTAGALEEVSFDVLSVSNGKSRETETPFQKLTIAINRNNKPEIRTAFLSDREVPLLARSAYKAKLNISENGRVGFPNNFMSEKLDKPIFDANTLAMHTEPIEDAKDKTYGVWHGTVGAIYTKNGTRIEVSSEGSLLPATVWVNDENDARNIMKGDDVVFDGLYSKSRGVKFTTFVMVAKEVRTNPTANIVV